ncbi:hypothetical protein [Streptomyces sp. NPDC005548]|uniref:hypothetical protein n=1 Tax=Streptomyces sp. NPDC005548 TaxID=3364724 RepID=UPI0036CD7689
MALERTLRDPIHLLDPELYVEPEPAPGCDICGALMRQLAEARNQEGSNYNLTKASDIVVEIGRHPHEDEEPK